MDHPLLSVKMIFLLILLFIGEVITALQCYTCSEQYTFKDIWDPYTDCQVNATNLPQDICLDRQQYCLVTRTTVKGITVAITRGCVEECLYGCYLANWGVTQLTCTTCCNSSLCNVMDAAPRASPFFLTLGARWSPWWGLAPLLLWTFGTACCGQPDRLFFV